VASSTGWSLARCHAQCGQTHRPLFSSGKLKLPGRQQDYYDIDSYGLLNGSVTLFSHGGSGWEFSIWGRNITQTYYRVSVNSNATTIFKIPGEPRTFGATAKIKF
jgi:hypothetical protein